MARSCLWFLSLVCIPASLYASAEQAAVGIPRGSSRAGGDAGPCGLSRLPPPLLANCVEPIAAGIPDMRGVWAGDGHWERIEQCGSRLVVSGPSSDSNASSTLFYIHDFLRLDGILANGCSDYSGPFFPACISIVVSGTYNASCISMYLFGQVLGAERCLAESGTTLLFYNAITEVRRRGPLTLMKSSVPPPAPSPPPSLFSF